MRRVPILLALALAGCQQAATSPAPDLSLPVGDFTLTERGGRVVSAADLRGGVWVASFVFTRCTGPCPQVTATVARLQKDLAGVPGVKLVTFTVDPGRDDPAELKRYADHFQADPERWLFLTGPEEQLHRLLKDGFRVGVERAEDPKPGEEYDHSTKLAVVDKRGNVRGYFDGMNSGTDAAFEANLARLRAAVTALARE